MLAKEYRRHWPNKADLKLGTSTLRKLMIQTLMDWVRLGKTTLDRSDVGDDIVGWKSVKSWVIHHYQHLTQDDMFRLMAALDQRLLPQQLTLLD